MYNEAIYLDQTDLIYHYDSKISRETIKTTKNQLIFVIIVKLLDLFLE